MISCPKYLHMKKLALKYNHISIPKVTIPVTFPLSSWEEFDRGEDPWSLKPCSDGVIIYCTVSVCEGKCSGIICEIFWDFFTSLGIVNQDGLVVKACKMCSPFAEKRAYYALPCKETETVSLVTKFQMWTVPSQGADMMSCLLGEKLAEFTLSLCTSKVETMLPVCKSQMWIVLSSEANTICFAFSEKIVQLTPSLWCLRGPKTMLTVLDSQMQIVVFAKADKMYSPSGEKATKNTMAMWPSKVGQIAQPCPTTW